jgi:hypothetical protein
MPTRADFERQAREARERSIAEFPFPRVTVPGARALDEWTALCGRGEGAPIVIGDDDALARIADQVTPWPGLPRKSLKEGSAHDSEIYARQASASTGADWRSGLNRPLATRRLACHT